MLMRNAVVGRIACLATIVMFVGAHGQETEVTVPTLDERHVSLTQGGYYAAPTSASRVGVTTDANGWLRYRSATTWDPTPLTDWAFLNSGTIRLRKPDPSGGGFDAYMQHMQSDPRSLSKENFYADCGDGTTYATYSVSTGWMDEWRNLTSTFLSHLEGRITSSWSAAGFKSSNEPGQSNTLA